MNLRGFAREWSLWVDHFCLNAPGSIGHQLRRWLFTKRCNQPIIDIFVCEGLYIRGWENLHFAKNLNIGKGCIIETSAGEIVLGEYVAFNSGVVISADFGKIEIGNNVMIGMNTVLRAAGHSFDKSPNVPMMLQPHKNNSIKIGNDVWIGANVTVLPGAVIHDHCVIGAGAVVSGTIATGVVAAGVPAKKIKMVYEDNVK